MKKLLAVLLVALDVVLMWDAEDALCTVGYKDNVS